MKYTHTFLNAVCLFLVALILVACSPSKVDLMIEITTPGGVVLMEEVEFSDRFPPECEEQACMQQAESSEQFIVIWASFPGQTFLSMDTIVSLAKAYVIAGDDSRTDLSEHGILGDSYYLLFRAPNDASDFSLYVADNQPIELGK